MKPEYLLVLVYFRSLLEGDNAVSLSTFCRCCFFCIELRLCVFRRGVISAQLRRVSASG